MDSMEVLYHICNDMSMGDRTMNMRRWRDICKRDVLTAIPGFQFLPMFKIGGYPIFGAFWRGNPVIGGIAGF